MNEGELWRRCREGGEQAWEDLHKLYYHRLFCYARTIVREPQAAEDIAQEAFVRLLVHTVSINEQLGPRAWLFRIAHNLAIDELRRRKRDVQPMPETREAEEHESFEANLPGGTPTPEEILMARENRDALDACLDELRPQDRAVVQLIYLEGFKFAEAAEILGVSQGTVAGRSQRGRQQLRECLKRKGLPL